MSEDGTITVVEDERGLSAATQEEIDTLPVGPDLTQDEIDGLERSYVLFWCGTPIAYTIADRIQRSGEKR
jgi:hypothetical protein